jgi:hypothetical protein
MVSGARHLFLARWTEYTPILRQAFAANYAIVRKQPIYQGNTPFFNPFHIGINEELRLRSYNNVLIKQIFFSKKSAWEVNNIEEFLYLCNRVSVIPNGKLFNFKIFKSFPKWKTLHTLISWKIRQNRYDGN